MKKVQNQGKVYIAIENPGLLPLAPFVSLRSIKAMGTCSGMAPLTLPGQVEEQVQKREALLKDKTGLETVSSRFN